jgi:hypothetical protein
MDELTRDTQVSLTVVSAAYGRAGRGRKIQRSPSPDTHNWVSKG